MLGSAWQCVGVLSSACHYWTVCGSAWECWAVLGNSGQCVAVHSGYSYYRGGGGIPIGAYLPPNMDIKIFFIKIIKFDFSLLQIMYILTQA